jgi:hypothetical protein
MTITCKPGWRASTAPAGDPEKTVVTIERQTDDAWIVHSVYTIAHAADQDPVALVAELFPIAFQ